MSLFGLKLQQKIKQSCELHLGYYSEEYCKEYMDAFLEDAIQKSPEFAKLVKNQIEGIDRFIQLLKSEK